jgi:xanthine dehydrogenase accessory factor
MSHRILLEAARLVAERKLFALCTVVDAKGSAPGKTGARMIVFHDRSQKGTVGGAGLEERVKKLAGEALSSGKSGIHSFDLAYYREGALDSLCGGRVQVFIEIMKPVPHILICGGGHVGLEVARLCAQLEYDHSVLDDRPEFSGRDRFPGARGLHTAVPEAFFAAVDLNRYSHLLLLGYSHRIDTEVLYEACSRMYPGWIGIISSRMKRREMIHRVKARGITDDRLRGVETPVGLSIGAESPAEIAVSILGSIIRHVKGSGSIPGAGETDDVDSEKAGERAD